MGASVGTVCSPPLVYAALVEGMEVLMKVLHIVASLAPRYGGPSISTYQMAKALVQQGLKVWIWTTNVDGNGRMDVPIGHPVKKGGVSIVYNNVYPCNRFGFSPSFAKAISASVCEFDIIHIHGVYSFPALVTAIYAHKHGIPYIVRPHGSLDPFLLRRHRWFKSFYHRVFARFMLNNAAAIHFTTEQERLLASWFGFSTPSFVLPHGVHLQDFSHLPDFGSFRKRFPELEGKKVILFLGRINFKKGLDLLVKGFKLLDPSKYDAHLLIIGPDTEGYSRQVKKWIAEEGIEARVSFADMVLGREKLAAFVDCDVFVLPSYSENLGVAVLEAMACRKPVVISDKVNICDEVMEGRAGIVVQCTPVSVAEGIRVLLDNPSMAAEFGMNGLNLVKRKYSWEPISRKLAEIYSQLVDGAANKRGH